VLAGFIVERKITIWSNKDKVTLWPLLSILWC